MITIGFFFYVTLVNTQWLLTTSPSSCQHTILPGQQTSTHTVLQALVCGGLSNPYLWHTEKWCKGKYIGLGHSTSVTLCPILVVAWLLAHLNLHKAKPDQPLCSYYHTESKTYCCLASQDILQILCALPYITCISVSVQLLWSAIHYVPAVLWHFSLVGLMPCSSSLLASGMLTPCFASCILMPCFASGMFSPASSCKDWPNSCLLVVIPSF